MQLILQATHGVVSGNPEFFKRAFGNSYEDFERILLMPQHFIFNRDWYELHEGKPEFDEFTAQFSRLTNSERDDLLALLSSVDVRFFDRLPEHASSSAVANILRFYVPLGKDTEAMIWKTPKQLPEVSDEERVEDAGLNEDAEANNYAEISA
jgi:hypothetical protein